MTTLLLLALLHAEAAPAKSIDAQIAAALPDFRLLRQAEGDLNGDGLPDIAAVLQEKGDGSDGPRAGMLAVFLRTTAGKLRLHTRAPDAVCPGCGGPKGDWSGVLGDPSIAKGILTMEYLGGSRDLWVFKQKWRLDPRKDRFVLIGETREDSDTLSDDGEVEPGQLSFEEINYLSGKMTRRISHRGTRHCQVRPELRGLELADFDWEAHTEGDRFVKGSCRK